MRTFSVYVLIPLVTIVYAIMVMVHMALFSEKVVFYRYARSWSRLLLRLAGVEVAVSANNVSTQLGAGQRCIYAANHSSMFDIPVLLAYLPDNIRIMYKQELERIPIFGWCLRMSPFIAVNRANARDATKAIQETVATIANGASVLVFPEGTRSVSGKLGDFKRGFVTLAVQSQTNIVPVAIMGTAAIMPANTRRVRGGRVSMVLLDVVSVPPQASRTEEQDLVVTVRTAISNAVSL